MLLVYTYRIRFGKIDVSSEWTRNGLGTEIRHMDIDLWIPGNILLTFGNSIQTLNPETHHADLIAGGDTGRGYVEGCGIDSRFKEPRTIFEYNGTHVAVADTKNCCVRLVSRVDNCTSVLAGRCQDCNHLRESTDSSSLLSDVAFGHILAVTKISNNQIALANWKLYRGELTMIDLLTNKVDLITYTDHEPISMCADPSGDNLFLASEYGIEVVDLKTRKIYHLTMSNGNTGHIDGSLQIARFSPYPYHLTFLQENVILMADWGNSALRVIDLFNNTVLAICQPGSSSAYGELTRD